MTSLFGQLTLATAGANLPIGAISQSAGLDKTGNATGLRISKLFVQLPPGNTGGSFAKVQGDTANYATTTAGTFIAVGVSWSIESQAEMNSIHLQQYFFSGSAAGDKLNWEVHIA